MFYFHSNQHGGQISSERVRGKMKFVEANISSGIINFAFLLPNELFFRFFRLFVLSKSVLSFIYCRIFYLQSTKTSRLASSASQVTRARRSASANHDTKSKHGRWRLDRSEAKTQRNSRWCGGGGGKTLVYSPRNNTWHCHPRPFFSFWKSRLLVNGHLPFIFMLFSIFLCSGVIREPLETRAKRKTS